MKKTSVSGGKNTSDVLDIFRVWNAVQKYNIKKIKVDMWVQFA